MDFIIYFCICICAVIIFAFCIGRVVKPYKQSEVKKGIPTKKVEEFKTEFETVKVQAKVIDMNCRVEMIGIKRPKSVKIFTVVFETDAKEIIKIDVPQEMYDGLEKGQHGELTLVEGELYSFII